MRLLRLLSPLRLALRIVLALTFMCGGGYVLQNLAGRGTSPVQDAVTRGSAVRGAGAGAQAAVVSRNIDGDTIEVFVVSEGLLPMKKSVTIRLVGIDTPETKKPDAPVACGGPAASSYTANLLSPGTKVALVPDVEKSDRYGRALRYVYTRAGLANVAIARAGYARPLLIEPNHAHIAQIRRAASDAERSGRGMWAACADPFAPRR